MPRLRITPSRGLLVGGAGAPPTASTSSPAASTMPTAMGTERVADSEQNQWVDYPCGDNPVAKAYLQTMKDLLTQMERMSSTQQFADSLAEPLNLAK